MLRLQHLPRKAVKTFPGVQSEFALLQFKCVLSYFMHHRHGKHIISIWFAIAFLCICSLFSHRSYIFCTVLLLLPCILTFHLLILVASLAHVFVVILIILPFLPRDLKQESSQWITSWQWIIKIFSPFEQRASASRPSSWPCAGLAPDCQQVSSTGVARIGCLPPDVPLK